MKKFNLNDYDLVQNRIQKFHKDYPDGRIITELVMDASNENLAVFKASIYIGDILKSTGWAKEYRDLELQVSNQGKQYESVNFSSHLENAESSAIGRCLANMGRHGDKRASREEMEAVERAKVKYEMACKAIDKRLEGVTDPASFEEVEKTLRSNPNWNQQYEGHLQQKFTQLMAKENGDK